MQTLLPSKSFAKAKAQLSDVMNDVVRSHHPYVVDRNRGKERMVLMSVADLLGLLEPYGFSTQVAVSDGEFVFRVPELNLTAGGESFEEGLDELVEVAETYARLLLDRFDFYAQTDRAGHIPWALRLALTPEDRRRDLLVPRPRGPSADRASAAVA